MKKALILLSILCFVCCTLFAVGASTAIAEDTYYMVEQDDLVQLNYYHFGRKATFRVPYGYTIAVYGTENDNGVAYAKVRFAGVEGYVLKTQVDALSVAASVSELPQVTVVVDGLTAYRFQDTTREAFDLASSDVLYYLGAATVGDIDYYAVKKEGENEVFFVVQSHANKLEIEAAVHPQNDQSGGGSVISPAEEQKPKESQGFTWMRFVLILGIVIPLITIVVMIVRPRRRPRQAREIYEDAEDYDGIDEV